MNKKSLTETEIRTRYITPAITKPGGWDLHTQVREEFLIQAGRIDVRGFAASRNKKSRAFADYVLFHRPNIPLAIVEAKDNNHSVGDGMQQALRYSEMLGVPFAYSANGDAFLEHDLTGQGPAVEREIPLDQFPSSEDLWARYKAWKGLDDDTSSIVSQDYFDDGSGKKPRYYQINAINRVIEANAKGQKRVLLVMATGTGKTYTAFQIIWRLWRAGKAKRILFLVDRNILADQAKVNDFKPFGSAMTKITKRKVDKSYEIYLALYQAVSGQEEWSNIYKEFSPDFFDLIVVDECHRSSADEASAWRAILTYFGSATQVGMTATPKETRDISNIAYFGEPVYTYSLRQGIEDGFLAPYKVLRIDTDKDLQGWRPTRGQKDRHGEEIEDREYNRTDFERTLVLEERTKRVAKRVTEYLKSIGRYSKTIIFCEDIDHAERMRQAMVNENPDLVAENYKYVMRITGDNDEGKAELDNFIDPEKRYPVVATTSKLMTTGIDAQTCKLVVLDRNINSMTEFKQIIGRGTRINEDYGKLYFTIMDFKNATHLFADPDFDGEPIKDDDFGEEGGLGDGDSGDGDSGGSGDDGGGEGGGGDDDIPVPRVKYYVNNVQVTIIAERVQYLDPQGKLITESLRDYTRNAINKEYASLNDFLRKWESADKKQAIVDELVDNGVFLEELERDVAKKTGSLEGYDPFDLVCHVAFEQPPLTRKERANNVRKRDYFTRYGDQVRAVLTALLDKYEDEGISNVEDIKVLQLDPFRGMGTPIEIVQQFGGKNGFQQAVKEMEQELYRNVS